MSVDLSSFEVSYARCLRCKAGLGPSGQEPYRYICTKCGQNYFVALQLVPVEPLRPPTLSEKTDAEGASRTAGSIGVFPESSE